MRPCSRPCGVQRGAAVTDEDQHGRECSTATHGSGSDEQDGRRAGTRRRRAGSARVASAARPTPAAASPTSSSAEVPPRPGPTSGSRSSSNDHPPSGHQNRSVFVHVPSKTRCSIVPIGRPEQQLAHRAAADRRQHHDDHQHQAEHQRVEHAGAAGHDVGERQHRPDDQQPVVERGIAEHEAHGDDRRADEPEEHGATGQGTSSRPHCGQSANSPGADAPAPRRARSATGRGGSHCSGCRRGGRRRHRRAGPAAARSARSTAPSMRGHQCGALGGDGRPARRRSRPRARASAPPPRAAAASSAGQCGVEAGDLVGQLRTAPRATPAPGRRGRRGARAIVVSSCISASASRGAMTVFSWASSRVRCGVSCSPSRSRRVDRAAPAPRSRLDGRGAPAAVVGERRGGRGGADRARGACGRRWASWSAVVSRRWSSSRSSVSTATTRTWTAASTGAGRAGRGRSGGTVVPPSIGT